MTTVAAIPRVLGEVTLAELELGLRGQLIRPSDEGYNEARRSGTVATTGPTSTSLATPVMSGCAPATATRSMSGWSGASAATTPPTSSNSTRKSPRSPRRGPAAVRCGRLVNDASRTSRCSSTRSPPPPATLSTATSAPDSSATAPSWTSASNTYAPATPRGLATRTPWPRPHQIADGRVIRLLNVVDEFTREALEMLVERSIDADRTVGVLERLAAQHGAPDRSTSVVTTGRS